MLWIRATTSSPHLPKDRPLEWDRHVRLQGGAHPFARNRNPTPHHLGALRPIRTQCRIRVIPVREYDTPGVATDNLLQTIRHKPFASVATRLQLVSPLLVPSECESQCSQPSPTNSYVPPHRHGLYPVEGIRYSPCSGCDVVRTVEYGMLPGFAPHVPNAPSGRRIRGFRPWGGRDYTPPPFSPIHFTYAARKPV